MPAVTSCQDAGGVDAATCTAVGQALSLNCIFGNFGATNNCIEGPMGIPWPSPLKHDALEYKYAAAQIRWAHPVVLRADTYVLFCWPCSNGLQRRLRLRRSQLCEPGPSDFKFYIFYIMRLL